MFEKALKNGFYKGKINPKKVCVVSPCNYPRFIAFNLQRQISLTKDTGSSLACADQSQNMNKKYSATLLIGARKKFLKLTRWI